MITREFLIESKNERDVTNFFIVEYEKNQNSQESFKIRYTHNRNWKKIPLMKDTTKETPNSIVSATLKLFKEGNILIEDTYSDKKIVSYSITKIYERSPNPM